ncbi:MAG: NYN domain-containing protein [Nanoarchaeota archaeon]|nr:NYN domain-containing protein [Nanoarchaeota archaeon]
MDVKKAVVFIDGNNVYHNLKKMKINPKSVSYIKLCNKICSHFNVSLEKIKYYNSIPNVEDNKEKYWKQYKYFEELKTSGIEVNTRKLQKLSNKERILKQKEIVSGLGLCDTCSPLVNSNCYDCIGDISTKEKGVDIAIAVSIVKYAIEHKCDCIVLISGDADFIPALELAEKIGITVYSVSLRSGYSYDLKNQFTHVIMGTTFITECIK